MTYMFYSAVLIRHSNASLINSDVEIKYPNLFTVANLP